MSNLLILTEMRVRSEKIFPQKFRSFRMIKNKRIQEIYVVSKKLFSLQTAKRGLLVQQILMHRKVCLSVCLSVCLRFRSPRGQAPDFSAKSISSRGFGAEGLSYTFLELGQQSKENVRCGILIFSPRPEKTGPEGGAGQGPKPNFGISILWNLGALRCCVVV